MATEAQKQQRAIMPDGISYIVHTSFEAPGQIPILKSAILRQCNDGFYSVYKHANAEPMFIRLGPLVIEDYKDRLTLTRGQIDTT